MPNPTDMAVAPRQTTIRERVEELNGLIRQCLDVAGDIQSGMMGSFPEEPKNGKCYADCLEGNLESANDGMRELFQVLAQIKDRL